MLRPASWSSVSGPNQGRAYFAPTGGPEGGLILVVHNLAVDEHQPSGSVQWELFQAAPTLAGWTAGLERAMTSDAVEYTILEQTPGAKVYVTLTAGRLALNAYVVNDGQPLTVALLANAETGTLEPLDRLRVSGLLHDFETMVGSVKAISQDPAKVSPPLG